MKKVFSCVKHPELAFYAGNKKHKFANGKFVTDDTFLIDKLMSMNEVEFEGDYDPSKEPKPEEDNLVKLIRAIAREEINAAFDDGYDEAEEDAAKEPKKVEDASKVEESDEVEKDPFEE